MKNNNYSSNRTNENYLEKIVLNAKDKTKGDISVYQDAEHTIHASGITSFNDHYKVRFIGQNPFGDPKKYGMSSNELEELIKKAAEESSELAKLLRVKPGVIVITGNMEVLPMPGVQVVYVPEKQKGYDDLKFPEIPTNNDMPDFPKIKPNNDMLNLREIKPNNDIPDMPVKKYQI